MPSTYTLNNGIELIGTGEQSGTWGDTTNTNLQLLDSALDGQVTVALSAAGSSGSPNTLPISNGAASNGRNRMVVFDDSSDLGAAAFVQLTPNDAEKIIYVRNDLSGSRSIVLFQGTYNASNDYEVPAGTTAVVYFDGAGSGAVAANVFNNAHFDAMNVVGNVTVGGNATVTGALDAGTVEFDNLSGTGAVSVTNILDEDNMSSDSATALATQQSIKAYVDSQVTAQDLDFAGGTGTGSVDLDSQTFTVAGTANEIETSASGQTVTVGLPNAVTIASLTATTADINGGTIDGTVIGGTTPAAGDFTALGATGNITVGGTVDGRDVASDGTKLDGIEAGADVTDTPNVTAAGALMDSEVTNLAQVKAFDSTDYATAAQGTLADSAVQPNDSPSFGSITVTGTVDGRDVASDGTKLDGIEALADVTDAANVTAAGALMDSELTSIASVKALNQGVATTDSPTFAGLDATGNITVGGTVDGRDVAADGTKLDGIEASADVTDTANVVASLTAGDNVTIDPDGTISSSASGGSSALTLDAKTTNYTVVSGDLGKVINCTGASSTISLTAAATLGSGFFFYLWNTANTASHVVSVNPNASETINGASTATINRNRAVKIVCDGANFRTQEMLNSPFNTNFSATNMNNVASGDSSIAIGDSVSATGTFGIAIGRNASASNTFAVALGTNAKSSGYGSTAMQSSSASGEDSFAVAINNSSTSYGATDTSAIAMGPLSKATAANSVAIGDGAISTTANLIALGGTTDTVQISGVYKLPTTDGTAGQVLSTDGSGNLSWITP